MLATVHDEGSVYLSHIGKNGGGCRLLPPAVGGGAAGGALAPLLVAVEGDGAMLGVVTGGDMLDVYQIALVPAPPDMVVIGTAHGW